MLPSVTAVMLVNGRHAMVARAVQSFMAQTYPADRRTLLIWDTGEPHYAPPFVYDPHGVEVWHRKAGPTIGELRNAANAEARGEIIVTFDSDDVSHPNRISEQVSCLQSSGADVVGYRDMLFWDEQVERDEKPDGTVLGYGVNEAWLYSNPLARGYALGTSLMYWRRTWERVHFDDVQKGEDDRFCRKVGVFRVVSVTSIPNWGDHGGITEPRMIASIHGSNTSSVIQPGHQQFKRVPQWDEYCRKAMELK